MNKIFKVIWSKSKQCYIVVSEMAKNHSGKKKIVVASILAAMAVGTTVFVEAARVSLGGGAAETEGSIAIGTNSFAKGTSFPKGGNTQVDPSIAIGTGASAEGNSSLAIGLSATVDKKSYAVAIGRYTKATDDYGIGIGYNVRADLHGVAVGEQARALKEGATTLGVSSRGYGKGAIAIGWQSLAGADVYTAGVPGNDINNDSSSKINDYNKWGDMSVGLRALATGGNATALGRNAAATATNAVAIGGGNGNNYDDNTERTQATAEKAVAIGYKALASDKNATSIGTDAQASKIRSTAIGYEVRATGNNAVAIGSSDTDARKVVAAGESAIAVGTKAQANNDSSTAIGKEALAGNTNAIALGTSAEGKGAASTAIGNSAQATKTNAIALGTEAEASEERAVAIGKGATAEQTNAVALGTSATSGGANGVAIGNDAQAQAADAIAVGTSSRATTANDNAFGNAANASGGGSTAVGYMVNTSGNKAFGAGSNTNVSGIGAVGIGYKVTSTGNRATAVGALAQSYSTSGIALGDNATVGVAEVKDSANRVTTAAVDAKHGVAIGTNAKVLAGQGSVALGWSTQVTADDVVNSSTDVGANRVSPYLLEGIGEDNSNDKGNGIVAIGTKRTAGGSGFARRLTGVAGAIQDYDAVNLKQLKALESNEWLLRTQNAGDANPTDVAPQTVNNQTKKRVTLKAGDNIAISNSNGVVTLNVTNVVKSVATDNTNALDISNTNGAVKINPKLATSVDAAGEANKLVTAGTVKTALDLKVNKADELHVKPGNYTVQSSGDVSLIQENANSQAQGDKGFTIKDVAKKSVVDTLQSDFNTFKAKAITFKGDDNQGVDRTLDSTLTVKGGANYTSTTTNTNIRVEKDGTTGLAVKLSDKLTGMKEISGTGSQDLVIKNGNTTVTVKAPTNGDNGTVDFGNAKVVASNLDASIKYRANDEAVGKAKSVKLADGFNFVASKDATTTAEGPKSGLSIKAEDNGKVTFGLDKATRNTIDNAADKNLSNLTQEGKNKVTELAKTAAKEAVKVAPGHNTTVLTDTSTAGVTTYTVHANDTTVAAGSEALTINNATPDTNKVRAYTVDLSAATKGKLAAVGNLANVIGGTSIAADGRVTGPTFSITNPAGTAENAGTIKEAIEKLDAANKGQNTKISETAGKVTTLGNTVTNNYNELSNKITQAGTNVTNALTEKGLNFTGNDTTDAGKVHRDLGTTLTIKGAENFTRAATETNNIKVVKNGDALDVKLAENLAKMKEISGDGTSDLVIKNGNTKVTVKAPTSGDKGTVDFGDAKVIAKNLDASIAYKAGNGDTKKTVKLQDGFNFTTATETTTTAEGPKSGLAITTGDNGVVTFGLDKATREKVDNAADKNLSNLSDTGKTTVKELAKGAAQDAVKVADGINTTVEKDTATAGVTTYKVNANDTTVAVTGNGLAITGGELGTDKVRKYSLDLSAATKGKLAAVGNLATNVIGGTTIAADGTVTGPTFNITKADGTAENAGTIKEAIEKLDAANKGQNTKISDTANKVTKLATALGGGAKVENGTFTGPTYNITKADGSGTETASNVGDAISKLDNRITTANGTLVTKGLDFTGNDTTDAGKVHRDLGTTLTIKGAENFTRAATETNNIKVVKNGDALDVKLAENLAKMKEISGDGTSDLVIKNGDTKVTVKAPTNGNKGTVDFGDAKVIAKNLDTSIAYKSNQDTAKKTVKLQDGFNFTAAADTTTTAEGPKSGLAITTGDNGVVTFGLDKATRSTIDNAADKNLSNLSNDGKNKVKELAGEAAKAAVTVAAGINTTVTTDTTTTAGVTTYKVNANDTTVAVTGDGLAIKGGDLGTDKVRKYSLDLSDATKGKLKAVDGLSTVIGGTNITTDGTVTGPTFNITKADGTTEEATTIKDAIDKLNATNAGQNTKISETESKVKDIVDKGMTFAGDNATADKVTRKLGETLNIHGQNNITVKKDGTAADTLNVKLASELKNITSISSGNGTTGSTVTLGADGVSIANTKDGATKTVTIGKDGINAGGMKITNVGEAKAEGDAANKKYVDDAISNLGNIVSGNATLNFAGNVTKNAQDQATEKVGLSLATGTLHVNGANNEITTTAKGDTITVGLAETVKAQLAKVGDTSSNGRDGKDGTSGAKGLTGKDGLNDKTLTDKVNALRNGEAGSVVYTNEAGDRVVKAKDGQYYKATDVDATGNVLNNAKPATSVEARVVNPDGTTTGGTTKLSNIADGKVAAGSKDAVNGGQLHTTKSEIGAIIGGTTINENGKITGPTFSITNEAGTAENAGTIKEAIEKLDAANKGQNTKISENTEKLTKLGETVTTNYNDLSKKITDGATNITNTLTTKGLDFTGNDITDAGKLHRDLGTTLTIKGTENFTRAATENNIKVVKNGDALDVKLAENLAKMKEISGDGTSDLVIKNGDTKVTVKAPTNGEKGTVDFGDAKVIAKNLDTSIAYKSNQDTAKKTVKLQDGFNFTAATDTTTTAEGPKSGLAITTGDNGVVTFGLDKATRSTIDNAADKDLSNLTDTGKTTVKELAKGAAQDAVKVADGINTTVEKDTTTTAGVTTYKVNANDTTVAVTGDGLAIKGGDLGTDKVRKYSLDLSDTVKAKLNAINNVGDTASNGRDGKDGTSGAQGLTGKDGLNDKTLTDKVNALRNGEAGSVVYTNDAGDRVVKAKDGKYYKADEVKADGTVKTAEENNGKAPKIVENPQARVVNGNGETTVPTTLSNIADGKVAADSKEAVNGGQLNTVKSDLATALGGGAKVENGVFTGPTYNITKDDGSNTTEEVKNVGDAISKLDGRINNANTTLANKGLDFTGNDTTAKVHRNLGETLTIKGAENFTRTATETNNIKVVKTDNDLNVKLAENLGNIKSISNTTGEGKPGSTITLGADGVSIANTAAGADGAAGETKTVTIGKDGINAGGMKVTNVAKATDNGDAANKEYVDEAISNLNTTVTNNANLRYAGDTNVGATNGEDHLNLPLATGTLKVAGTADQIKTVANNGTITLSLAEKVTDKLAKLGDTSSNGRDGKDGTSGAQGLTGKDGLNDKTLTEKVNALRNGEAGSVVYTNDAGDRVVKAKDGKYYKADEVKADGTVKTAEENNGKAPKVVENPQARVVNGNGETTVPTTLSNIADGKVAANSKEAVNGGQLNTVKSDLATALGGGAKVENGTFTGPTYNITKDDGTGKEAVNNVGDAISKLDGRINNANTALGNKGLDFYGNKDAADTDKVHRNLGEALKVKGAENFTREANAKNNIDVVKNTAGDGFDVKLAENLGNIKEIAGNGKDNLVIKNGDATITLKPKKEAEGTNPATPATVDFGDTKVVASNLDASIKYRANDEAATNAKSVKLADGFNFVASTDATTTAEGPKSGLAITAEDNGKVTFGLDKATREKVDNAADKNLSNLTDAGKNKVKELAGEAAKAAVTVADGINTTVTTDTTTTTGVTTYKVNANDTTVAVNADSLAIAGGDLDATTKVRAYTLDLSDTVKAKLNAINNVGDTASNGRDGVNGTSGATGLTGKDGLNDKTLTDKVNALRNGEAGSVVYTNDAGDRVVKAKDGKYYKADEVKADGTVKTAEENKGKAPEEVKTPQARVVNPNGETTAPTTLSNIADGKVAADSKEAVNGGQLHTVKSDLATALGGGAKVENGTFTGPTYNITKDDGTGTEAVKNVGDAITKLDGRINNANTVLGNKGLDFTGNDTTDAGKVHRNLGETLTIKGAENFTRTDAETNNIKVVKNNNDLDVKLAENLGNIKEIAGNGKDDLVIKNGDATITLKPKKEAEGTNPATPATVDFGNTKVVAPNLEASITYRANSAEDAEAKTVTLQKGLNFVSGDGTAATAEAAKAGITIAADKDGKVVFGLNEATRNAIDNAADKNLNNLSQEGKDKVADLAKTAAREAVKVTAGNNVTVTPETKDGVTTYTVNGRDTTVKAADNGSVSVTGGTLNAKGEREYTVDLTADAKAELGKISDLNTRLGSAEGKITTLQGDMTKAKDDIAANTKAIDSNKEAIATNKNAIADNARDIAANRKDIDTNKQGIAENKKQIGENAKAIAKNAEDIKKNVEDTKKNTQDIKKNADAIKANTDRIQTVENRVTTAEGKIATNEKAIKDNASAIQSNTKAIGANTTAIAKNASDITKANKEIESLKGNSATKDLSNLTNTGKDTITNLINVTGEHGITVTPSTDTTTRVKTFTAKLNDTVTFGSGDKKITVDGTTGTVTSKAVAADTVKANTVNAKTVQLGDSTGTNTTVTADGIAVTTKNPDGTTSKVEIKNGTVSGLTNTKWDPAKVVTDADRSVVATQGQVKDVTDTLARGRVFVGDTGSTVTVGLGDTLAIKGGSTKALTDDNIGVVSTEAKDGKPATMTVKLAKDVKMKDGSTSYDYYLPEIKTNPDGSKEIVKNADGSVKHQLGKDGNPVRLVTTTVNGEGITIAPVKGLDKPTVSLTADGLDNGGNQIHNVAAGTANTDAATVGQVRAAAHALNNRVNEAGAHAAALAAMNPLSYDPLKKSQVMAGVGSYKGNKALALGVAHYANEDTLFNVGVAVGDGSNMVNAGVTYRFGGEDSAVPERYKGGPISSVYVMQDEVSALKAENAEMKEQMKMLMERIEMLAAK